MDESLNTTNSQITTTVKATGRLVPYEYVKTCLGVSDVGVFDAASCACAVDRDSYGFVSFTRKSSRSALAKSKPNGYAVDIVNQC